MKYSYCDKMGLIQIVLLVLLCFMKSSYAAEKEFKCGFPGEPAYGSVKSNNASYPEGASVEYTCNVRHILLGSPISRCREDGTWSEEVPICDDSMLTLLAASSSPTVPGYPSELAIDTYYDTCTYLQPKKLRYWRIDLGERVYKVLSVALTMKTLDKNLKFTVYIVEMKTIEGLIEGNYRRCASFSGKFGTPKIILQCAEGKGINGKIVHVEDHNAQDGLFEICEVEVQVQKDTAYSCGSPSRNLHSIVKKRNNDYVEYDCLRGYRLTGKNYRRCLSTGQWSDTPPLCVPIICDELEPLDNGNITFHHGNSGPILEGAIAIYKCIEGYKLTGLFTRTCLEDGSWSGQRPKCKAIRCPIPDGAVVGGVYRLINKTNNMGSMAVLRCKGGKLEGDSPYITCTENGEWTLPEAECVIPARASSASAEKRQPPRIVNQGGIIFGMVVAAVMIVVVLVGLYLYGQKRRNNKPEIPSRLIEPPSPPPRPPPRGKENSFKTAFKGFLNRENSESDKQALKDSWKSQSLPSNQAHPDESSPKKALSYGETFPDGNESDTVVEVEVLAPDHSKVKRTYPSLPEEPENGTADETALEMDGEESANDSSARSPDYAAVDYEKKRQSRVLKEQESMESSTSAAASPLPDDESEGKLTSHSPTPPKRISESEEEEDESEESEASRKLNITDNEESQKDSDAKKKELEEEERKAKEEMEQKKKEEEIRKAKEEEEKRKEEEEKKKKEEAAPVPGSRRRRVRDEPVPPAEEEKPVLRRLRRFQ